MVEVAASAPELRGYLAAEMRRHVAEGGLLEALPGHLEGDPATQARLPRLIELIERLCAS
jgi:hypothetical protein